MIMVTSSATRLFDRATVSTLQSQPGTQPNLYQIGDLFIISFAGMYYERQGLSAWQCISFQHRLEVAVMAWLLLRIRLLPSALSSPRCR